jgi:putative metalloprotease
MVQFLIPLALALIYAFVSMRLSVWQTQRTLDQKSRPLRDPEVQALADRMATALDIPAITVNVLDADPVNGLAAPDGRIFLTRGFVAKKATGEVTAAELASVIAHEMGHVAQGHLRRRMIDFTGQNAVFMLLAGVLNRFLPFIGIWIANLISAALMARLTRRDEFEADAWASALLIKSGIGTGPQISLFRKLDALTENRAEGIPAWLLSHPKTAERIAAIEANEKRWLG